MYYFSTVHKTRSRQTHDRVSMNHWFSLQPSRKLKLHYIPNSLLQANKPLLHFLQSFFKFCNFTEHLTVEELKSFSVKAKCIKNNSEIIQMPIRTRSINQPSSTPKVRDHIYFLDRQWFNKTSLLVRKKVYSIVICRKINSEHLLRKLLSKNIAWFKWKAKERISEESG